MDRFKFRVWNKQSNCYTKERMFYINEFGSLLKYERSRSTVYINADSPCVMGFCGCNYIIEQCTGLKDKNGKLIYEGDILKIKWNNDGYPRYYEVNFEDGAFGIKPLECNDWLDSEYLSDIPQETLIIGNIHENPELLEDK